MALVDCLTCCQIKNLDTGEILYEVTENESEKHEKFLEVLGSLCEDYNGSMYYYENADISKWQLADDQILDDDGGWIPYREPVILAGYLMSKGISFDDACEEGISEPDEYIYQIAFPDLRIETEERLKIRFL